MKRTCTLLIVFLMSFCLVVAAQEETETDKPKFTFGEEFDAFVHTVLKELNVPGLALAVVQNDRVIYAKGYGLADVEAQRPVDTKTMFAIGSSTKAFTATSLAILVDRGDLDWDTPVREYLPDFRMHDDYATRHLTPLDLVSHRSGLPRHDLLWYGSELSREELYHRLRFLEPNKSFRESFEYQNLMYLTAGYLAAQLYGDTWENIVRTEILEPLGMADANFSVTRLAEVENSALGYRWDSDEETFEVQDYRNIDAIGPAGSINAHVEDMARWVMLQLGDGAVGDARILETSTMQAMHTIVTPISSYPANDLRGMMGYARGWFVEWYRGHYLLHHGGNIDGFSALVAFMPHADFGIVALANANGSPAPTLVARRVYDHMLSLEPHDWLQEVVDAIKSAEEAAEEGKEEQAEEDKAASPGPNLPLENYAGKYHNKGYGEVIIALKDGQLVAQYNGEPMLLKHDQFDQFVPAEEEDTVPGLRLFFEIGSTGTVESMRVPLEPTLDPIVFKKAAAESLQTEDYLGQFEGSYKLGPQVAVFAVEGGVLTIQVTNQPKLKLEPVDKNRFKIADIPIDITIEFKLDDDGKVVEVVFNQPNGVFRMKPVDEEPDEAAEEGQ